MDKRWILIFIIILIGAGGAYLVIESSNTVGSAITDISKSTVTMPDGFSKGDVNKDDVLLVNKKTDEKIYLKDLGNSDLSKVKFNNKMKSYLNDGMEITNNTTINVDNITVYTFYYLNGTEFNNSISYFYSYNHTYYLKITGYTDANKINEDMNFVVSTLQPDYKKSQD